MSDTDQYEADATAPVGAENILAAITRVARELREAQENVRHQEEVLKLAKERVRVLEERTLPDMMDEAGQKRLTTIDGYDLERGETLRASIAPSNLPAAVMWLRANDHGSIVKRELTLSFGKDEDQRAAAAADLLLHDGFLPVDKMSVHPQTLSAAVREMVAAGTEVPMELLGAYVQPWVKMRTPK